MCGFVGTMGQNSLASFSLLEKSVDSIGHRGSPSLQPQFYKSQMFCCGFSRLDICDLNDRANQPFFKEGYEHIMCFNGEIYNFQELKNELINLDIHLRPHLILKCFIMHIIILAKNASKN